MRIAIAGATGVYGRNLIPRLLGAGHRVLALARVPQKARDLFGDAIDEAACDLLANDPAVPLSGLLAGCDAVLHLATSIPANARTAADWEANTRLRTEGTRALLDAALAAGAARYVQQSITMAYPDGGDAWIDEQTPLATSGSVISPVVEMEAMVRAVPVERLHWCILRGALFVGPDTFQVRTLARLREGAERVPCDGRYWASYIHVADMAAATLDALERAPVGSVFNIAAEPVRQGDYLDQLAAIAGAPAPPRNPDTPCPPSWRISSGAARRALGWQPTHGIYPSSAR